MDFSPHKKYNFAFPCKSETIILQEASRNWLVQEEKKE